MNQRTLGFRLMSADERNSYQGGPVVAYPPPTNGFDFFWQILMTVWNKQGSDFRRNVDGRTVLIENGGVETTEFDLSSDRRNSLIDNGREAVRAHFGLNSSDQKGSEDSQAAPVESRSNLLLYPSHATENPSFVSASSPDVSHNDIKSQKHSPH